MRENVTIICVNILDEKRLNKYLYSVRQYEAKGYAAQPSTSEQTSDNSVKVTTVMKKVYTPGRDDKC